MQGLGILNACEGYKACDLRGDLEVGGDKKLCVRGVLMFVYN